MNGGRDGMGGTEQTAGSDHLGPGPRGIGLRSRRTTLSIHGGMNRTTALARHSLIRHPLSIRSRAQLPILHLRRPSQGVLQDPPCGWRSLPRRTGERRQSLGFIFWCLARLRGGNIDVVWVGMGRSVGWFVGHGGSGIGI